MKRAPGTILAVLILAFGAGSPAEAGRWRDALKHAATDPRTWVPAAGAVVIASAGYDDDLSEWAVREAPVFGSPMKARASSDLLRTATHAGMLATNLFAHPEARLSRRFKGAAIQFAAASGANNSASVFKRITRRTRPDGSDELSLPSNHATAAFAYAAMGSRNLERMRLSGPVRRGLSIGLRTLAAASAWGRVEGGVHYPSDVLLGAALGNFAATFLTEALLPSNGDVRLGLALSPDTVQASVSWSF